MVAGEILTSSTDRYLENKPHHENQQKFHNYPSR
jgi:hypothetical protein